MSLLKKISGFKKAEPIEPIAGGLADGSGGGAAIGPRTLAPLARGDEPAEIFPPGRPCPQDGCCLIWLDPFGGTHCELCDPPPGRSLVMRRLVVVDDPWAEGSEKFRLEDYFRARKEAER